MPTSSITILSKKRRDDGRAETSFQSSGSVGSSSSSYEGFERFAGSSKAIAAMPKSSQVCRRPSLLGMSVGPALSATRVLKEQLVEYWDALTLYCGNRLESGEDGAYCH